MSSRLSMNTTFRPRPIDINRPLEIHRGILPSEADGCVRGVPSLPTGMEPEEEEEAHIQEAIAASLAFNASADIEIPTPICRVVDGYDTAANPNPYLPGHTYIFFKGDDIENSVEYDVDSDDEYFLNTLNATKKLVTEDKFEFAMDRFEKEAHFHPAQEISLSRAEALLKGGTGGAVRKEVIAPLLEHWRSRRAAKDGNSLIVRFLKPPAFDDPSPYVAFRPREKDKEKFKRIRKNDPVALAKMRALRQEMERSRTLLEMLKKREKLKKDQMAIAAQVFEQLLLELPVKSEDDSKQPLAKRPKKNHNATTPPSTITSPVPSISSPVDQASKQRTAGPKSVRPDYYYDIATVNTRLKMDPSQALPPYFLSHKPPSRSPSTSSSTTPTSSLYPSFLNTLARKPAQTPAQRSAWQLEDEDELSDFEDNDALLFDDEEEDEEEDSEEERTPNFAEEIAKLDENAFFPRRIDGHIATSRTSTPFRGRARLGRGGRILFDRPIRFTPPPTAPSPPSTFPVSSATSPILTTTPPLPSTTSPLPSSSALLSSSPSLSQSSTLSPILTGDDPTDNNHQTNNNKIYERDTENNTNNDTYVDNDAQSDTNTSTDNNEEEEEEKGGERDVEMAVENGSDSEDFGNSKPSQRSSSPINSDPEARLLFTHRPSPTQHNTSSPSSPPPKLFSSSSRNSSSTPVLPPANHNVSTSPSPSPPPSSPSSSCIDKMPTVLHTYSKKQQQQQKRKFVDTSIPTISM